MDLDLSSAESLPNMKQSRLPTVRLKGTGPVLSAVTVVDKPSAYSGVVPPPIRTLSQPKTPADRDPHRHRRFDVPWMSFVLLCTVLGLASIEFADVASRRGYGNVNASVLFWFGLVLIFAPITGRALMRDTQRRERLTLVLLLGAALYGVKVLGSPNAFTYIDEYIHVRSTQDILRTHHLFASNPLLPTASYYPGLGTLTASLADLSGLSVFTSGLIIIGVARVLISACVFLVAERVTGSSRSAAGASVIYAANPMFLFWSASFSYENLALPLAAFTIWWVGRTRQATLRPALIGAVIAIAAVSVTHHVVSFALAALLTAWWLAERLARNPHPARRSVGLLALVAMAASLSWFFLVAKPAHAYLIGDVSVALRQTGSLILGHTAPRQLYANGGSSAPTWQTWAGFAAVGIILLALPPALYRAWKRRDHVSIAIAIIVAVCFPLTLVPRLAPDAVAISARSWEYVFIGLGCVLGLLAKDASWPRHRREKQWTKLRALVGWRRTAVATALVTLVFVGDVTIGTASSQLLPESSHPQGYPWSVQPDVIDASTWARDHLGINQRFAANAIDSLALATYGEQDTVSEKSIWPIFFSQTMGSTVVDTIRSQQVRYLLVDSRMTKGFPPTGGYYFSSLEPGAAQFKSVFPATDLKKFNSAPCTRVIYSSGPLQILDVSRIADGSCTPGSVPHSGDGGASA